MNYLIPVTIVTWASSRVYCETQKYRLKEIPSHFEVKSGTNNNFHKLFDHIENIAKHENMTILYKVKLEVVKPTRHKKGTSKKMKTKKYNIPLKKNSMKLSNFEVMLRKMAEKTGHSVNVQNLENLNNTVLTTETDKKILPMRQVMLKYKPIIARVKTNYTKIIRPVRKKFIILT